MKKKMNPERKKLSSEFDSHISIQVENAKNIILPPFGVRERKMLIENEFRD